MADTEHVDNALADAGQSAAAPKPPESAEPPPPMWPPWGRPGYGELKSCVALSTCYFFMFSAWNSAQTLASTLPIPPPASGNTAMFIVYLTFAFSSFVSPVIVHSVGAKRCVTVSFCMYGTYIAANMYPRWWTLYPGACNVGFAASPLWVSQGILITHFAMVYAHKRGEADVTGHVGFFNGIFGMFMLLTGVSGNLISSAVFSLSDATGDDCEGAANETAGAVVEDDEVPQSVVDTLFAIYLFSVACGVVMAQMTLPAQEDMFSQREEYHLAVDDGKPNHPSLWTTVKMLKQPRMYLLGPIYAGQGLVMAFISAAFTKDVIEPNLGECNVGYVMAANSAAAAAVSINIGKLTDQFGRPAVMAFAVGCIMTMIVCLRWAPPTSSVGIYILGIIIGVGLASLRTPLSAQLSANYRDDTEAAFAASEMFSNVGACAGFLFADSLSLDTQLDLGAVLCLLGFAGYFAEAQKVHEKLPPRKFHALCFGTCAVAASATAALVSERSALAAGLVMAGSVNVFGCTVFFHRMYQREMSSGAGYQAGERVGGVNSLATGLVEN